LVSDPPLPANTRVSIGPFSMTYLLHHLPLARAERAPDSVAVLFGDAVITYAELAVAIERTSTGLVRLGLHARERVAFYLDKRAETIATAFGTAAAGGIFVPINPLLKSLQVGHILCDCGVRVLVTTSDRLLALASTLEECRDLRHIVIVDSTGDDAPAIAGKSRWSWAALVSNTGGHRHRSIDTDVVALFYTSGSTGAPKGVVLTHRNMVVGAKSVAEYLENDHCDVILSALPLSFDAGFSQLTTAFHAGARVALLNYLMPRDVLHALSAYRVTGLTAVPPLWISLAQLAWADDTADRLRYIANTGGRMPRETLALLRQRLPRTKTFLMYGLTEAFRSTYLPPSEVDRRPDSIGRAIPNAEILVLRQDGTPCAPGEPGELVHRGALVSLGYWNDPVRTAERFKPLPVGASNGRSGVVIPEMAVFSGDTVKMDSEGFLYFVGRFDEMIKTSGYRVSPTEVEEALYSTKLVAEAAAYGVAHPTMGQAIAVAVTPPLGGVIEVDCLLAECRKVLPAYMVPARVDVHQGPLPRNPNGKIDRKSLAADYQTRANVL
jgi:acyl-CoA ligase (AMP-forming) (exosortase A-associated)